MACLAVPTWQPLPLGSTPYVLLPFLPSITTPSDLLVIIQHYNTKNFIWRPDDWLLANRWEAIVANRTSIDFVEVNTWNDYGESHYIGPIEGIQPNSQAWVDGYDHTPWLDLYKYYIAAYKTGTYPQITTDRTFVWGRTYPVDVVATADTLPKPDHYTWVCLLFRLSLSRHI